MIETLRKLESEINPEFEHSLASQFSNVTEMGAIAAYVASGMGDKEGADNAAVEAMRWAFSQVHFNGTVVIGEGERDEAPMLYIGEKIGNGEGREMDIAIDPLENTNATANILEGAISVLAASEKGGLLHAPDTYMNKLIVGPKSRGKVDITAPIEWNLKQIATSLNRRIDQLVVVVLERKRNEKIVKSIRKAGAKVKLILDGDLLPGISVGMRGSGLHAVMGIGAAPEGVMTAAGLRCLGGEMQGKFWPMSEEDSKRIVKMGGDLDKVYNQDELASGKNIIFSATGVTDNGKLLEGVNLFDGGVSTKTLLMTHRNKNQKVKFIETTRLFESRDPSSPFRL